ncbi:MAG: EAL domain-containing protein [Alphaproteobacteria bacterium]
MATVLYIDHRPDERGDMLSQLLERGYDALTAECGHSGLAAALRHKPDLVLCQTELTEMSGLEVLQQLRDSGGECESTLFVLLSMEQDQQKRQHHIDLGADDSLPGDMDFGQLMAHLAARLRIIDRQTHRRERELIKLYNALTRPAPEVSISTDKDRIESMPGLPDRHTFAKIASARLLAAHEEGAETHLTLIEVPGLDVLANGAGDPAAGKLLSDIGVLLASQSGDAAGILDKDRFGLIHGNEIDSAQLRQSIDQLISDSGLDQKGVAAITAPVELSADGLSAEEAVRALVYAVNHFADQGSENFTITNLQEGIAGFLKDTVARISSLRGDINGNRIELHFQPIVELASRKPHHYEALARFPDGKSPYQTIIFAEQVGMVQELDLAICQKVIEYIEQNIHDPGTIEVAMNLSAQSIESSVFISVLRKMLSRLGNNRHQVLLEITESVQIRDFEAVSKVVRQLREDGHRVCLDDFGAGDSNFNYLRMFEVDFVKIDGVYVRDVLRSKRDQAFIRAIARLCQEIGVGTVAEFIEDGKQADSLKNLGVDFGQGHLFGKPAPHPLGRI